MPTVAGAFPVFQDQQGQRNHEPLEWKVIQRLKESVSTYGVQAAFAVTQVESRVAQLILKGIKVGLGAFGKQPDVKRIEVLTSTNWLQFVMTRTEPIPGAVNVFADGSKGGVGVVYVEGNQPQAHVFPYQSAQAVELCAVLQVFQEVEEAFNLVSDSQYVVQAVQQLETVGAIKAASTVRTLLSSLQKNDLRKEASFLHCTY